jgi:hypothetical protein
MAASQALAIALSKDGAATVLSAILPAISQIQVTVPDIAPMTNPVAAGIEPEYLRIYDINVSGMRASLLRLDQHPSQPGPPSSCTFDALIHLGFHVQTKWEEKGDTGE